MLKLFIPILITTLAVLTACQSAAAPAQSTSPSAPEPSKSNPASQLQSDSPPSNVDIGASEAPATNDRADAQDMASVGAEANVSEEAESGNAEASAVLSEPAIPQTAQPEASTELESPAQSVAYGNELNNAAFEFTLPSATGPEYSLEFFRGDKNVVLVFYRGFW